MFLTRFLYGPGRQQGHDGAPLLPRNGTGTRTSSGQPTNLQDDFSPESLPCGYMRPLYDYWCERRGGQSMPPADAIDPMLLPRSCLPHLCILEVEHEDLRLRARLTGTTLVEHLGLDLTGLYLDELPGIATQINRLLWCVTHVQPYVAKASVSFAPNDFMRYQILTLPFGKPGGPVERLVCAFHFLSSDKTTKPDH